MDAKIVADLDQKKLPPVAPPAKVPEKSVEKGPDRPLEIVQEKLPARVPEKFAPKPP